MRTGAATRPQVARRLQRPGQLALCPSVRKTPEIEALLAERIMQRVIMDGNGRLSRVLVHYTLCQTGALERGHILPISAGMKRHELDYLAALQSFSRPAG